MFFRLFVPQFGNTHVQFAPGIKYNKESIKALCVRKSKEYILAKQFYLTNTILYFQLCLNLYRTYRINTTVSRPVPRILLIMKLEQKSLCAM